MSLSRRKFTKEFKEAAVRRLELGVSVAEAGDDTGYFRLDAPPAQLIVGTTMDSGNSSD